MSSKCTFLFENNPLAVYSSGQLLSGTAELVTVRPKTIRAITITISGFAEVRWTENVTKPDTHGKPTKAIETYSGSEVYYSNTVCVYGQSGGMQLEFPAGRHVFPFQYPIPLNVPTSVSGGWGHVRHEVSLVIDRVMRYNNVFKQGYTVISPHDLNINRQFLEPLHKIDEKEFCWSLCCRSSGPLVMTVRVPFAAYAPGQRIPLHIVVDNQSEINCSNVKVRLMKLITYTSRSPEVKTKTVETKVADNHCGGVIKRNKAEYMEYLQLPSTPPTTNNNCSIIKVSYSLKFIAKTSRFYSDLTISFPLTIGTIPICNSVLESPPMRTELPVSSRESILRSPVAAEPVYEEDGRCEQFEGDSFKPRYPFYVQPAYILPSNKNGMAAAPPSVPALMSDSSTHTKTISTFGNFVNPTERFRESVEEPSGQVLGFSIPPDYQPTSSDITINNHKL